MAAPAPYQPDGSETGITRPGMAAVLLHTFQSDAFLHREIVRKGKFEFILQAVRNDRFGLTPKDYTWIFDKLVSTKPPEIHEMPNGTILNEYGHIVPATRDDRRAAEHMADTIASGPRRVFLG